MERRIACHFDPPGGVSIHAPVMERPFTIIVHPFEFLVSIHAPVMERRFGDFRYMSLAGFQFTLL